MRCGWLLLLVLCLPWLPVRAERVPLDPATLAGAGIFAAADEEIAAAAAATGAIFTPDSHPLPPQVILTFDTPDGRLQQKHGVLFWRGDMLPDQLAPGDSGTLIRRRRNAAGVWQTVRAQPHAAPEAPTNAIPATCAAAPIPLPTMILETPYQLGAIAGQPVRLVLWRAPTEGSAPLGGFLDIPDAAPGLAAALQTRQAPFADRDVWTSLFNALRPQPVPER